MFKYLAVRKLLPILERLYQAHSLFFFARKIAATVIKYGTTKQRNTAIVAGISLPVVPSLFISGCSKKIFIYHPSQKLSGIPIQPSRLGIIAYIPAA